jgi:hypothetical protein
MRIHRVEMITRDVLPQLILQILISCYAQNSIDFLEKKESIILVEYDCGKEGRNAE